MGKRGPKPKPTALKVLSGSWRAQVNPEEPHFPRGYPPKPTNFTPEESLLWDHFIEQLYPLGLISPSYGKALETLVRAISEEREAEDLIRRTGILVKKKDGTAGLNPVLIVRDRARIFVAKGLADFGMTPAASTKIRVDNAIIASLPQPTQSLVENTRNLLDR